MTCKDLKDKVANGIALLIDVREQHEYNRDGISLFKNIPLSRFSLSEFDLEKELYIACQSGNRSGMATRTLLANGYNATNIGSVHSYRMCFGA